MTNQLEARYLSGTDLGQTVTYQIGESQIRGVVYAISPVADLVEETTYADLVEGRERWALGKRIVTVAVLSGGETMENALSMGHLVTITGQDETNA